MKADIVMDISQNTKIKDSWTMKTPWVFVAGMVLPWWNSSEISISVKVRKKGNIGNYKSKKEKLHIVTWLPLIVVMPLTIPFNNPISKENKLIENVYKNLILEMQKNRLFN